jgi:type VI secretion system protein ImpH
MTPAAQDVSPRQTDLGKYMMSLGGMRHSQHPLFAHGGNLWKRTLSSHQVRQVLESYFEVPIVIEEYQGSFKLIAEEDLTRLGRQYSVLGQGASIGNRYWEETAGITLHVGPIPLEVYEHFMPGAPGHKALLDVARGFLSPEFDISLDVSLDPKTNPLPILGENIKLGLVGALC